MSVAVAYALAQLPCLSLAATSSPVAAQTAAPIVQEAYAKASPSGSGDQFGASAAVCGDTMVVGARFEDSAATGVNGNPFNDDAENSGAAYIFVKTELGWVQNAYLKASSTDAEDWFGRAVAISGDTVVVGAELDDSGASGVNGNDADNSVPNSGAVYVFRRTGSEWAQEAYIKPLHVGAGDQFGSFVAIDGDTLVVGALAEDSAAAGVDGDPTNDDAVNAGAAYVFTRAGSQWTQEAYLKASNPGASDLFGRCVAVSGGMVVVGAAREDSAAAVVNGDQHDNRMENAGAAYVFERAGGAWGQISYLKSPFPGAGDGFGSVVDVHGDTVVATAPFEDSSATGVDGDGTNNGAAASGAAYVFERDAAGYACQAYLKASNTDANDAFGAAAAISERRIVIGAPLERSSATGINGSGADDSMGAAGAAYVFSRVGSTWAQDAYVKASNTGAGDLFSLHVSISGSSVAIGAPGESSGVGGDQGDNSAFRAGAVYLFDMDGLGERYCSAPTNSSGDAACIFATGSTDASLNQLTLTASSMPANAAGFFLVSSSQGFVPGVNGTSNGNLCLGGAIARYVGPGEILQSDAGGQFSLALDLSSIPQSTGGPMAVQPGDTLNFQGWFRDSVGLGSNLTDGISVTFQ